MTQDAQQTKNPGEPSRHEDRERRPSLGPAIVSGGCAVAVALITGIFNWVNRPGPAEPTPTLRVERTTREPVRTVSLDLHPEPVQPRGLEPKYGLNFAAYQAVIKDLTVSDEVRQKVTEQVTGKTVIWKGYVNTVSSHEPNGDGSVATVGLVETPIVLDQAMFQLPAFCGFRPGDDKPLKQLKPGQLVTISGTCSGFKAVGTFLTNCYLIEETARSNKTTVR